MIDLASYELQIQQLCEALHVQELELFGSATRNDFSNKSDVDVLVTFQGKDQLFKRYFDLKEGLERIFGRSVDVIMPEAVTNPIFRQHMNAERETIYGA